jgi:hypothetical protein
METIHKKKNPVEKEFCFFFTFFIHHILLTTLPFMQLLTTKTPLPAPSSSTIYLLYHTA